MSRRLIKVPAKVVIDTGPLILFLAGNYDPESIPKMKRIKYDGKPCNAVHYDILKQYLSHAKERLITPGILSEAWNLIDNDISNRKDKEELFYANLNYFKLVHEIHIPKDEILSHRCLSQKAWKFGFTDSSIILCAKNNNACVLTQDYPLFNICKNLKIETSHLSSVLSLAEI